MTDPLETRPSSVWVMSVQRTCGDPPEELGLWRPAVQGHSLKVIGTGKDDRVTEFLLVI